MCPYYHESYKECNLAGHKPSDDYHKEEKCLGSNWRNCSWYYNRSFEEKVSKKVRPNPDL
jgi:hypothetical protein